MDNYWFSAAAFASLVRHLPNAHFSDATGLVNWQRAVKSEAEIACMRRAARIVEAMHARIAATARPGIRKCDLVAEIYDAGLRGTPEFGGDYPAIVPLLPSGSDAAHRGNLNRSFPGNPGGTVTEKIADHVTRTLLPMADLVLDSIRAAGRSTSCRSAPPTSSPIPSRKPAASQPSKPSRRRGR
jgi:hypothetical protein